MVCPQGLKFDSQRFAWDNPSTVADRVQAAIEAARQRFGNYIASGPTIYAGFSQGATLPARYYSTNATAFRSWRSRRAATICSAIRLSCRSCMPKGLLA